jgi:hypothetical protein
MSILPSSRLKVSLEQICQKITPFSGQLPLDGRMEILTASIAQRIAPVFPNLENHLLLSLSRDTKVIVAESIAKILTVWHSRFALSVLEMNARLPLLKGELECMIFNDKCQELNNIVNAEGIFCEMAANIPEMAANQFFWDEIRRLTEQGISTEHACLIVLFTNYPNADLSTLKTSNSYMSRDWMYRDLSMIFVQHGFWDLASTAASLCSTLDANNGAFNFRDLCQFAIEQNNQEKAWLFQVKSQELSQDAGGQSLMAILERKIKLAIDPKSAFDEIEAHLTQLLDLDREYGLRCIIEVAKKAVNAQETDLAVALVERAGKEQQLRKCSRGRNHSDDVRPHAEMAKFCVRLKQYELSELFARKVDTRFTHLSWHLTDIVTSKLADEIVDHRLIDELHSCERLTEELVFKILTVLFAQNRMNEARQLIIRQFKGLEQIVRNLMIQRLEKILQPKGIETKNWLKQAPEYSQIYSLDDALEEENVTFLLQHANSTEEALKLYQKHLEIPGVLDLLIEVANQKNRSFSRTKAAIEGIGLALGIESLREQAKQALLLLAMVQDTYPDYYTLRIQALNELVTHAKEDLAVQELMHAIITKETREIVQRAALTLHDGLSGKPQAAFNDAVGIRMLNELIPVLDQRQTQQKLLYLLSHNKSKMGACIPILEKSLLVLFNSMDDVLTREETHLPRLGSLTPLGLTDTTWDQLYELLLILGFIAENTRSHETYSQIEEKICSIVIGGRSKMDADAALDALHMISRNKSFKISENSCTLFEQSAHETQPRNKDRTGLEFRHSLHGHQSEYLSSIALEYQALLGIASSDEEAVETRILALRRLCDYALPDQAWFVEARYNEQVWEYLKELNSKQVPDLMAKEIKRIYYWRNKN